MKHLRLAAKQLLLLLVLLCFSTNTVHAALSQKQRAVLTTGIGYFNVEEHPVCTGQQNLGVQSAGLLPGSTIYMLGDSLTVGMDQSGGLAEKFVENEWSATKINAVGGENLAWGLEQVQADAESIRNSTVVVIGLGTNNVGDVVNGDQPVAGGKENVQNQVQSIIAAVKATNPTASIYWTSVYVTGSLTTQYGTFNLDIARDILNEAITDAAEANNVNLIPWGTSGEAQSLISSDGIHPSGKYPEMADYVVEQLQGTGTNQVGSPGCVCSVSQLPGSSDMEKAFNYFTGQKGLSPEIAAGILGNMVAESGIVPMRLQGEFDRLVPSSEAIEIAKPGSNLGWGLVQWTPGTKIIQTSRDAGVAFEEIDTLEFQLDFLWGQLSGEGSKGDPNNTYNEKSAGDAVFASTSLEEATINFGLRYERFGGSQDLSNPEYQERIDKALEIFNTVSPAGNATVTCASDRRAGPNGWDLPNEGPNPMVYYSQRTSGDDPAVLNYFGSDPYGPGTIAFCGCGPTSWAMIVSTLTTQQVTPPVVAEWASSNGFQQESDGECGGSEWWWMDNPTLTAERWGVAARSITIDEAASVLRSGSLIMVSADAGPFTSNGHLLVMRAVTDDGKFLFADPNDYNDTRPEADVFDGGSKSRTPLAPEDFMGSVKGLWEVRAI